MKLNDKTQVAMHLANALHSDANQLYDGKPYLVHLQAVVDVLLDFDVTDRNLLAAGYLHDAMEDCGLPAAVVEVMFGPEVTNLVLAVTDEPGVNRKERKAKTYVKIKASNDALAIKLADRIANVEHSIKSGNVRMFKMYRKEMADFTANLYTPNIHEAMWARLRGSIAGGTQKFDHGASNAAHQDSKPTVA